MSALPAFDGSRLAREHAAAAREGELTLQHCRQCGLNQYPFRELCAHCLSDGLEWSRTSRSGVVIATVRVHASMHRFFRDNAPWRICSVNLDAGPRVIAHARDGTIESGCQVEVSEQRVGPSHFVLFAKSGA